MIVKTKYSPIRIVSTFLMMLSVIIFTGCQKEDPVDDLVDPQTRAVNRWIYDYMESVYFWNRTIPSDDGVTSNPVPEDFFYSLVKKPEDKWSYITPDAAALIAEFSGTPVSMGFSPAFVLLQSSNQLIMVIQFVYPGSPASLAGLKRGDIIVSINGQTLTVENYAELYLQPSFIIGLGDMNGGTVTPNGVTKNLSAETIVSNPVLLDTIYTFGGRKTGYLVYSEFIQGTNKIFLNRIDSTFQYFGSEGINELIVDLRYNPGGETKVAQRIASAIVPSANMTNSDILVKYVYNNDLQNYIINTYGTNSSLLSERFSDNPHNLNLNRVFFLTSGRTASASELLITGLDPYMDVVVIGDSTYGKYTGSWLITDENEPPKHNYAMMPIVIKYANSLGETDFADGLPPDYYLRENFTDLKSLGNTEDPFLLKAAEIISGQMRKSLTDRQVPDYRLYMDPLFAKRTQLFLNSELQRKGPGEFQIIE
jgi:C-terminal processing protease CtpA/Prc